VERQQAQAPWQEPVLQLGALPERALESPQSEALARLVAF